MKTLKNGKYNKAVYMPTVTFRDIETVLRYWPHALEQAEQDRYGVIELPDTINLSRVELVEMEVVNNKIYKVVVRSHYNTQLDLVHVILLETMSVKTVWLNRKNDRHHTLRNAHEFVQKPKRKVWQS